MSRTGTQTGSGWEQRLLDVFDDLEQQAAGLHLLERDAEVEDLTAAEYAEVDLEARLRASLGRPLRLRLAGGWEPAGDLLRVGPGWALVGADPARWLVGLAHVTCVSGAAERAAHASARRLGDAVSLRSLLRRVVLEVGDGPEGTARVHLVDGHRLEGRLGRAGADFVEVSAGAHHAPTLVPYAALAAVRWSAW